MPRLSVVVPVYKVEPYIEACLGSLARQEVADFEAILVDDGSPDGSAAIAERFAERDARFRLVRQENGGLGRARKIGAALARGAFLSRVFLVPHRRTHVSRMRWLLSDRMAQNKLWRRSFWERHELGFPTGVFHEDIAVVIRAHVLARAVDVVKAPVYLYREREDGTLSITQRRAELRVLLDRLAAVEQASAFLGGRSARLKRGYDE